MKNRVILLGVLFCLGFTVPTCQQGKEAGVPPKESSGEPLHAGKDVVPGSYEDWCGEHEVPESLCTRCNPSLIAAFKATGDWCEEHNLPESQCKRCNPDLKIERPPKPEGK